VRSALRSATARLRAARAGDVPDDPDLPEELLDL
jgi:hypothetical protein